jgi:hypothetical protein
LAAVVVVDHDMLAEAEQAVIFTMLHMQLLQVQLNQSLLVAAVVVQVPVVETEAVDLTLYLML